jgi:predicted amidohydrolase YtcJ
MALASAVIPAPSRDAQMRALKAALNHYSQLGFTAADDIVMEADAADLYIQLEQRQELPLRVTLSPPLHGDMEAYEQLRARLNSPMLGFGFLKGFVDGVIESRTAYMLAAYEGTAERGKPLIEPNTLERLVQDATGRGFSVGLHAIGDAAVRLALDAFETALAKHPKAPVRHRVEHIEILHPADAHRFRALGVVASMQPFHANPGGPNPDSGAWSVNLGKSRLSMTFPWRTLLDSGATLAFGTDWPVMSASPLWGLAVAVTRRDQDGQPVAGWNAQQALKGTEAIDAFSHGAAASVRREGRGGRLAVGQWADVVILSPDVDLDRPQTLWKGKVTHVVVAGKVVQHSPSQAADP